MRIKIIPLLTLFCLSFSLTAQDYSTYGEIYDYEVGDIFHYKELHYTHDYWLFRDINVEIVQKIQSTWGDTLTYVKFVKTYTDVQPGPSGYEEYYENKVIPDQNLIFIADSIYYSGDYNGRKISYTDFTYGDVEHFHEYVDGCGRTVYYYKYWDPAPNQKSIRLLYFKKGDEEWGTPNPVVGLKEQLLENDFIIIFPNPTRDKIHLAAGDDIVIKDVRIYNQAGKEVLILSSEFEIIDISSLSPGLYLVYVSTEKGRICRKLIKE